jgi:Spy/CpxP family protein refolding chaperone
MNPIHRVGFVTLLTAGVLLSSGSWAAAQGQRRGGGFGRGQTSDPLSLAGQAAVQKELEFTPEQVEKVTKISEAASEERRSEFQKLIPAGTNFRNLSDADRQKLTEANRALQAKFGEQLTEILKPEQLQRLKEISLQASGAAVLERDEITKALELSKAQQDKLAILGAEYGLKQRELFGQGAAGGGGDPQERAQQIRKLGAEHTAKALEILTADQRQKFQGMQGKPFDLSQLQRGGGRPAGAGNQ